MTKYAVFPFFIPTVFSSLLREHIYANRPRERERERDSKIWVKILHMTEGWVINSSHFKMKDV